MATSTRRGWILIPITVFLALTGIFWPFLDNEDTTSPDQAPKTDVVVLNWKWNRSVKGHLFAVFGEIENKGAQDLEEVVLELHTMDAEQKTLNRHRFPAGTVKAGALKHFRHDIPRTGKETEGYLEVVETTPAP